MIRTKIVATMGPACGDVDNLHRLFQAGVDVCRLNFSHGDLDRHLKMLRNIREAAAGGASPSQFSAISAVPRSGLVRSPVTACRSAVGDELVFQRAPRRRRGRVSTIYSDFVDDVQVGHRLLIEDGLLRFICTEKRFRSSLQLHDRRRPEKLQGDQPARYARQCPLHHRP